MILVLTGAGAVASTSLLALAWSLPLVALVFGVTVAGLGMAPGPLSRALINPAVSLAYVTAGKLRACALIPVMFFQVLGAITGGIILRLVFPVSIMSRFLGSTLLSTSITPSAGTLLESAGTFALCSAILYLPSNRFGPRRKSIIVGSTLFILILILGPLTSASLNPARSMGPAFASNHLDNLGVYLVGPCAGGLASGLVGRIRK